MTNTNKNLTGNHQNNGGNKMSKMFNVLIFMMILVIAGLFIALTIQFPKGEVIMPAIVITFASVLSMIEMIKHILK